MARNPKLFVHGTLVEVCFRLEEGLYLTSTPEMREILISYLARAQSLYNVNICHFIVMSNHLHVLIVVTDPQHVKNFVCYFKRETAHAINRLLDRRRHTVWCSEYDSPTILDFDKAMDRIVYIYTNPQQACLVDKIEQYPNLSSWKAFLSNGEEIHTKRIPRTAISPLPKRALSMKEKKAMAISLLSKGREDCTLVITPNAWFSCFPETVNASADDIRSLAITRIKQKEKELREVRTRPVIGDHALRLQSFTKPHKPKKFGKKMICLSSFSNYRKAFIKWFRSYCSGADHWAHICPPGMFAPGGFLYANLLPFIVPIMGSASNG